MDQLPETMLEAHVDEDTNVSIHRVPVPQLSSPSQILIKVVCSGTNPKDWKMPANILKTIGHCPNSGDDIAGVVVAVGSGVVDIKPGDRVAALHQLGKPHGSFAEYAIAWDFTTFHLGPDIPFEAAATLPMALMMASLALFGMLRINPHPWVPGDEKRTPLVIYGAGSTVGSTAVKLAQIANIHPVICVAGNGIPFVESLIDKGKGDTVIDYRNGNDAIVEGIKEALNGEKKLRYAFDAVSEKGSYVNLGHVLDTNGGKITLVLPANLAGVLPRGVEQTTTMAGSLWPGLRSRKDIEQTAEQVGNVGLADGGPEFALLYSRLLGKWVREGKLAPPSYEIAGGGLRGIEEALKRLRNGETGKKFVIRLDETPELLDKA